MNTLPVALRNTMAALSLAALLTACGGGGGGSSNDNTAYQPTTPPATDTATPDDSVATPGPDDSTDGADQDQTQAPQQPPQVADRDATLVWDSPTTNTDGSCLAELDGYRVSYGLAPRVYENAEVLEAADVSCVDSGETDACGRILTCSYTVKDLDVATWYFAIQAVDSAGNVSDYSNDASKTIYPN